jgi:hypothetical protein
VASPRNTYRYSTEIRPASQLIGSGKILQINLFAPIRTAIFGDKNARQ